MYMNKSFFIVFLLFFDKLGAQTFKTNGTWVNMEIYKAVQHDSASLDLNEIIPRCIYIDLSNKITIEYRFEQKSKTSLISNISKKRGSVFFHALGCNFSIINDSVILLFNNKGKISFQKVNDHAVIGSGIEDLLKKYFWSVYKKWKVVIFKNGRATDTVLASIGANRIYGDVDNAIFRKYEFTDVMKYHVNGEQLFGIDFFNVNKNNMSDSNEVFAIKKSEPFVYLYKGGELFYKLEPNR